MKLASFAISAALSAFTLLCSRHHHQLQNLVHLPKWNLCPHYLLTPSLPPPHLSARSASWEFGCSGRLLESGVLQDLSFGERAYFTWHRVLRALTFLGARTTEAVWEPPWPQDASNRSDGISWSVTSSAGMFCTPTCEPRAGFAGPQEPSLRFPACVWRPGSCVDAGRPLTS